MTLLALLRRNPAFARLLAAAVVSMLGDWFSFVAVAEALHAITRRSSDATLAYALTVMPIFILAPIAGALADRFDRRRIMLLADVLRIPLAVGLPLAVQLQSPGLLLLLVALLSAGAAFSDPVASAALPNLVRPEDLNAAQSLFGAAWGSMLIVGASLGGVTAAYFGATTAFLIDAATFLVSALLLWGIRVPMQQPRAAPDASPPPILPFLRTHPLHRLLLGANSGVGCANGNVGLLPGLVPLRYPGANSLGMLLAARGLGAMLGPLLGKWTLGIAPSVRQILAICAASTFLYAGAYALLPLATKLVVAGLIVMVAHVGGGTQWALSAYALQTHTPDALRGRIMSYNYAAGTLTIGTSGLLAWGLDMALGPVRAMYTLSLVGTLYGVIWLGLARRWLVAPRNVAA